MVAVQILDTITEEKRLPIKPQVFDVKRTHPFSDGYFNAVYSHMLLSMRMDELHFIFTSN
jgi:hypothetical protein